MGRTGLSVARHLQSSGFRIAVTDSRAAPPELEGVKALGSSVVTRIGGFDVQLLERADIVVTSPGVPLDDPFFVQARSRGLDQVTYGVRPESFQSSDDQGLSVAVTVVEALGSDAFVYGTIAGEGGGRAVVARVNPRRPPRKGETLRLVPTVGEVHVFDVQTGERLSPAPAV
jgi:hypothetical protein